MRVCHTTLVAVGHTVCRMWHGCMRDAMRLGGRKFRIKKGAETEIKNLSQCVQLNRFVVAEPSAIHSG